MTTLQVPDRGTVTLHLWQRPAKGGLADAMASSRVNVVSDAGTATLTGGRTDDYLLHVATIAGFGRIDWGPADTDVSLAYVFNPEAVADKGIEVLLTTPVNAPSTKRYRCHLKPPFGWMNDPNGMSFQGDRLHVFYQHYPHARHWNSMHWGHAATDNMVDWHHYPIFLHPRADLLKDKRQSGGAFSGSAIPQPDGSLAIFYTDRDDDRLPNWEWQMLAHSADWISAGPSEAIIPDRPPHPNAVRDNRDSYVYRDPDGRWSLLLGGADNTAGVIYRYETDDPSGLRDWRYAGIFYSDPITGAMPLECPCLVSLGGPGEGLHLLIFGIIGMRDPETKRRHLSFGVVGKLEGGRFEPQHRFEMDFGTDAYAFQAIDHADDPIAIAWAANWADVFKDHDFPSAMTFPRLLQFDGKRLLTPPHPSVDLLRDGVLASGDLASAKKLALADGLGELVVDGIGGKPFQLRLDHPTHKLSLDYDGDLLELVFAPPDHRVRPRYQRKVGRLDDLRLFIDVGLIELFANGGEHCCSKRIDSDEPITGLSLSFGEPVAGSFTLHRLRPARNEITYGPSGRPHD